jgi:hypothetical protein
MERCTWVQTFSMLQTGQRTSLKPIVDKVCPVRQAVGHMVLVWQMKLDFHFSDSTLGRWGAQGIN